MCESKTVQREISTKEFAKLAKVTPKTVQEYCRRVTDGDEKTLKILKEFYGLVSVKRSPNKWRWILTVEVEQ